MYLDELLRHEGLGAATEGSQCSSCMRTAGSYRCRSCLEPSLVCQTCIVDAHKMMPLHRVEVSIL